MQTSHRAVDRKDAIKEAAADRESEARASCRNREPRWSKWMSSSFLLGSRYSLEIRLIKCSPNVGICWACTGTYGPFHSPGEQCDESLRSPILSSLLDIIGSPISVKYVSDSSARQLIWCTNSCFIVLVNDWSRVKATVEHLNYLFRPYLCK